MAGPMRVLKLAALALAGALYVWVEAVLHTPKVKRRKALRRRGRSAPKS